MTSYGCNPIFEIISNLRNSSFTTVLMLLRTSCQVLSQLIIFRGRRLILNLTLGAKSLICHAFSFVSYTAICEAVHLLHPRFICRPASGESAPLADVSGL